MLNSHQRARLLLWLGIIACFCIFWFAGAWFDIPTMRGYAGSLLAGEGGLVRLIVTAVLFFVCLLVGTVIAGRVHYEAGLYCAAVGMSALSMRGGPMRFVVFGATGPAVYLLLALELAVLFAIVAGGWLLRRRLLAAGWLHDDPPAPDEADEPLDQKLLATAAHAMVMIVLMMLLSQSDTKAQALASVGLSSYLASLAAHHFVATRPSAWFWAGPLLVGLIGYISQYISPGDWMIGDARGFFASLARPLPLDYASLGTAGAILGYWTSRRWQLNRAQLVPET